MTIEETTQYKRTKKKLLKKHVINEDDIKNTLSKFQKDSQDPSLHYKKMTCKKDKDRYSLYKSFKYPIQNTNDSS